MIKAEEENYSPSDGFAQGFDAIWALAFALNNTITMISDHAIENTDCGLLNKTGSLVPLHMFNYSNELMGCIIKWNLQRTDFTGVTVSHNIHMHMPSIPYIRSCSSCWNSSCNTSHVQ